MLSDEYALSMVKLMIQLLIQETFVEFVFLYTRSQNMVNPEQGNPHTMIAFQFLFLLNQHPLIQSLPCIR